MIHNSNKINLKWDSLEIQDKAKAKIGRTKKNYNKGTALERSVEKLLWGMGWGCGCAFISFTHAKHRPNSDADPNFKHMFGPLSGLHR